MEISNLREILKEELVKH